ncbi:hypothetical protein KZP23_01680 [Echinicola marina]|uniref:hypothetical protein n=1 Tax=Echinicola marina TaxID=2859768 RepID=UPI001CF67EA0|nr:hypothetical protein [Echinicola marina]UCS93773.1 hypothetical protein KZP23_01680 [Echinicola marina]
MKIFGNNGDRIDYLEEERLKIWERITELEKDLKAKSSDSEKEAKEHSKKAALFRNRAESRLKEATDFLSDIEKEVELIAGLGKSTEEKVKEIDDLLLTIKNAESSLSNLEELQEKFPNIDDHLNNLETLSESITDYHSKSQASLNNINKRKKEVDEIYFEIFGYDQENDETGETQHIGGVKEELEEAYSQLIEDIDQGKKDLEKLNSSYKENYKDFEKEYHKKYTQITEEIAGLLPNALTAGLSSAFSSKKTDEVMSAKWHRITFFSGIGLMILVSMIPAAVSYYYITLDVPLDEVILKLPRVVLAILPIYIPILWLAYSSNKKLNLSKRLIEEYSHKEVLSRTYEGLTKQIANMGDKDNSEELRFRLLANFLQVTSENPGKLISNYEASDHPLMEALEQSYKFQLVIDKLEGIPGMGKIAAILDKKKQKKFEEKEKIINEAWKVNVEEPEDEN